MSKNIQRAQLKQKWLPSPYLIFLLVYVLFYYLPVLYLAFFEHDLNFCYTDNFFEASTVFLLSLLFPAVIFFRTRLRIMPMLPSSVDDKLYCRMYKVILICALSGGGYMFFYAFFSGLNKLGILGSAVDSTSFRFMGYEDSAIRFQIPLELFRRVLLPFASVYSAVAYYYRRTRQDLLLLLFLLTILLLGSTLTLDRAPVLLAMVTLMFCIYVYSPTNKRFLFFVFPLFLVLLPIVGAVVTMLQYNLMDFNYEIIKEQAYAVAVNRIWLDPLNMSCQYSYNLFDGWNGCLWLKHSRLTSFLTGNYVGSYSEFSVFITPVGIVGDVWRNMGYIGVGVIPLVLAFLLMYIGRRMGRCRPVFVYLILFLSLMFSFYVNYGNLFTYGAALLFVMMLWLTTARFRRLPARTEG